MILHVLLGSLQLYFCIKTHCIITFISQIINHASDFSEREKERVYNTQKHYSGNIFLSQFRGVFWLDQKPVQQSANILYIPAAQVLASAHSSTVPNPYLSFKRSVFESSVLYFPLIWSFNFKHCSLSPHVIYTKCIQLLFLAC